MIEQTERPECPKSEHLKSELNFVRFPNRRLDFGHLLYFDFWTGIFFQSIKQQLWFGRQKSFSPNSARHRLRRQVWAWKREPRCLTGRPRRTPPRRFLLAKSCGKCGRSLQSQRTESWKSPAFSTRTCRWPAIQRGNRTFGLRLFGWSKVTEIGTRPV